ncbi:MAG: outer membrane protein assembly factor BamA, partial [Desulfohalobiaceae bacterium]|nr:outer membrane protein assembly factor BamA [Desulfohalobiaceae bacterium]
TQRLIKDGEQDLDDPSLVRPLLEDSEADFAVFGSVSLIGGVVSLDARLMSRVESVRSKSLYVSRKGLINLLPAVNELGDKIQDLVRAKDKIVEVEVRGNENLGDDFVLMRLRTQEGDLYRQDMVSQDLQTLFETGYFDDIVVHVEEADSGKKVIFEVQEKPLLKSIVIEGAEAVDEDDILEAMSTKTGSVINPTVISSDLQRIRQMYRKKGYYQAQVDFTRDRIEPGAERLVIRIEEGKKQYIQKVTIKGADKLDEGDLKDQLALSERGLFSWITGRGVLNEDLLDRDASALQAYYANRGFLDAKVGQPVVEFKEEGIHITFQVVEGPRYTVDGVEIVGDLISPVQELREVIKMDELAREEDFFDRSVLRNDVQKLTEYYTNYGYAFADIQSDLSVDREENRVDVVYNLSRQQLVRIRRVTISGNRKTRDNVIRREMRLTGGELFSGQKLARSKEALNKLNYFESVDIETRPTEDPGLMDLRVNVREKSTGRMSMGVGYSTVDYLFVQGEVQETNLLGKGYNVGLLAALSGRSQRFIFSFWNPHLYDGPVGIGTELYNKEREYDDYKFQSKGGELKSAYTLGEYTRLFGGYRLEQYTVDDIDTDVSQTIKDLEGDNWGSVLFASVQRDTTNRWFNPSRGTKNTLSLEYGGGLIGGDNNFIKPEYEFSYFRSLFWKFVFHWHWKAGFLFENTDEDIPDFERFYLGGIDTVRGYEFRDISSTDDAGEDIGGHKAFYNNLELIFPIKEDAGVLGVLFFDSGKVWGKDEDLDFDLFDSVGAGIRWNSPMGPLRLVYGYPLDDLKGNSGRFEFAIGTFF